MTEPSLNPQTILQWLKNERDQKILIVFDRFGFDIANWISESATQMDIPFSARFIPLVAQQEYSKTGFLPADLRECIKSFEILITILSDFEECTRFRSALLDYAQSREIKIVHLPGINWQMFSSALKDINSNKLDEMAQPLKGELINASIIEIITEDKRKIKHKLILDLVKGRKVHIDCGIPQTGEIVQLPFGEVYLAPKEFTATGTIVINGSVPDRVFRDSDQIILNIENGIVDIDKCQFSDSRNSKGFRNELSKYKSL